jgi:hypothetical protein
VASNVCLALHNLAEHCEATRDDATNDLTRPFVDLARAANPNPNPNPDRNPDRNPNPNPSP